MGEVSDVVDAVLYLQNATFVTGANIRVDGGIHEKVALAYTPNCQWRNRTEFVNGRDEIVAFLTRKWVKELDYRLIKELWAFSGNRIAVRFAYEWHDDSGNWFRSFGNENWEFDDDGLMRLRLANINDLPIRASERKYYRHLGRRPDNHPGLSDHGF
jgi:nuclear transport factor 2 (NTF2) superfamily protein